MPFTLVRTEFFSSGGTPQTKEHDWSRNDTNATVIPIAYASQCDF